MMNKTENKSIPNWLLAGLLIALLLLLSSCGVKSDLRDISADISTHNILFKSERGFGNDRLDIYAFSLKKSGDISGFHKVSDESAQFFWDFLVMIDIEAINDPSQASSLMALKADINRVRHQEDGQYLYIELNSTSKLYVYSPALNTGYCLILVI